MSRSSRKGSQSITIQTVAERAGVSTMTVSNVLNNRKPVREGTRRAVLEAVRELGYKPNVAARTLASAAALRIGLICGKLESGYLSSLFSGVIEEASNLAVQLVMRRFDRPGAEILLAAIEEMAQSGADAVIAHPPYCEVISAAERPLPIPIVAISPGLELPNMPCVRIDDRRAAKEMTRHLIALGHRHLGIIRLDPDLLADRSRYDGFRDALAEAGISFDERLAAQASISFASALHATEQLLSISPRPTAIFGSSDELAAAAITVAHRKGIDVPRELSITGFDDGPLATKVWPALTTVRQPVATIAAVAIQQAVGMVRRPDAGVAPGTTYLDFSLVMRDSTSSAPTESTSAPPKKLAAHRSS